jgi:hypothetical protein
MAVNIVSDIVSMFEKRGKGGKKGGRKGERERDCLNPAPSYYTLFLLSIQGP